jgi:hypothetical protein
LCLILGLNLLVPVIAISLLSSDSSKKSLATPSETDKFVIKKGANADLHEVKQRKEFWLIFLSFSIMTGIARMMNDNAAIIALSN